MESKDSNRYKNTSTKRTPSRRGLYSKVAKHAGDAILVLVELMNNSKNDTVRISAAKAILDKTLPDIKAVAIETNASPSPDPILGGMSVQFVSSEIKREEEL